jgi:hypothetical protein
MVLRKTTGTILQEVQGENPDTTARILWERPLVILHGIPWKNPDIPITGPPEEAVAGYIFHPGI